MSVLIIGGNECMVGRYEKLCREYSCKAKVFAKTVNGIRNFGTPDLLVLFTGTMSHKMLYSAAEQAKTTHTCGAQPDRICHGTQKHP